MNLGDHRSDVASQRLDGQGEAPVSCAKLKDRHSVLVFSCGWRSVKVEFRQHFYRVTFEALDWLCIAERLEDWSHVTSWPEEQDDGRQAIITWSRGVYSAAISDRERITLPLPKVWAWHLLKVLTDAQGDDEFPWMLQPQLIGQIKSQNRRR